MSKVTEKTDKTQSNNIQNLKGGNEQHDEKDKEK
jgi:hypothetical protein